MIRNLYKSESGYSLVEVMASIIILSIAIIPMVGMFDMGLNAANRGSNYDKARAFANERLERAKVFTYADARNNFPVPSSRPRTPSDTPPGTGNYVSPVLPVPIEAGLPGAATYRVTKQYVVVLPGMNTLQNSNTDSRMMRVTIAVNWPNGNSISVSGVVAAGVQ